MSEIKQQLYELELAGKSLSGDQLIDESLSEVAEMVERWLRKFNWCDYRAFTFEGTGRKADLAEHIRFSLDLVVQYLKGILLNSEEESPKLIARSRMGIVEQVGLIRGHMIEFSRISGGK